MISAGRRGKTVHICAETAKLLDALIGEFGLTGIKIVTRRRASSLAPLPIAADEHGTVDNADPAGGGSGELLSPARRRTCIEHR
jgi:hypothetical protein